MMQNKIQKAFGQICADDALKDTTKKAVLEKAYGKQVRKPFTTKRIYSYGLLASFALCCIIFMGKYLYFTPTAVKMCIRDRQKSEKSTGKWSAAHHVLWRNTGTERSKHYHRMGTHADQMRSGRCQRR